MRNDDGARHRSAQGKQGGEQLLVSNTWEMMDDGRRWATMGDDG
jgi:hypothetical protein